MIPTYQKFPKLSCHLYIYPYLSCCCCCCIASVVSDSVRPHRQPTRLPRPRDSPGKNTGVACHFLLQYVKVKSESEVAQSCLTLATPWTAAHQAPLSMGFSRRKYWSGVPLPKVCPCLYWMWTLKSTLLRQRGLYWWTRKRHLNYIPSSTHFTPRLTIQAFLVNKKGLIPMNCITWNEGNGYKTQC